MSERRVRIYPDEGLVYIPKHILRALNTRELMLRETEGVLVLYTPDMTPELVSKALDIIKEELRLRALMTM